MKWSYVVAVCLSLLIAWWVFGGGMVKKSEVPVGETSVVQIKGLNLPTKTINDKKVLIR